MREAKSSQTLDSLSSFIAMRSLWMKSGKARFARSGQCPSAQRPASSGAERCAAGPLRPKAENPLHWTLDMVFDEDHSRARSGFAAENLAILRHLEFNLIRRDKVTEGGMSRKKKTMTWNEDKLLKALFAA